MIRFCHDAASLVTRWIAASPENKEQFQRYQQLWKASRWNYESYEPDMIRAWQRIKPVTEAPAVERGIHRQQPIFTWLRGVAAVLLIGLLLGAGVYVYQQRSSPTIAWTVTATAKGQKSSVQLADGTVVWLNANSRLRYPNTFEKEQREVFLEGEAFFEVAKDAHKPFLIHTGQTVTRALGTSFDVRGYVAEGAVQVVVVTGRVAFSNRNKQAEAVILTPGEKAVWNTKAQQITQSTNGNPNFLAWKTGRLAFRNTPLREVLPTLEQYYGVRIQAQTPALLNCRFTGTFQEAPLERVLEVFAYGSGITYQSVEAGLRTERKRMRG